jgi:hypothetical protein
VQRLLASPIALRIAAVLGSATRYAGALARSGPGALGALLVSYGAHLAWHPLGFIAAGVFLLLLDRRVP